MIEPITLSYATHPTRRGPRELFADLYLPEARERPADLITWMHAGGFRTGNRSHPSHAKAAKLFAEHGYAMAFIDYRLARPPAILAPGTEARLEELIADATAGGIEMNETFFGPRPLGVVEDCCAFLRFIAGAAEDHGLSGRMLLGGSSAGAISALNTLYLPRHLGLDRPEIATVFSFSGGFAYPSFVHDTGARILALHSELDDRVPISSIRRLAEQAGDPVVLIESIENKHGELTLSAREPLAVAVKRCVAFDRADHPLSIF